MYDATSEPNEFVADSNAEAIAKACRFYSLEKEELRIVEIDPGGEVAGMGSRAAVVAVPKNATPPRSRPRSDSSEGSHREARSDRGRGRERGRDRGGDRDRGRGRGGDRGDRDRSRGAERSHSSENRGGSGGRSESAEDTGERVENAKGTAEGSVGPIGEFILGAVERMGLGEFTISESNEGDFIIYQLRGPAARRLGAGDGRAALQLLANQAEMRRSEDPSRIVVDAEGEEEERNQFLTRLAERAAHRASDTGRAVALEPMNGRDRRVLHMTVRELDAVVTMSIGSGRYRQVVIVPEGAPEYEEALAASEAASERS